MPPELAPRVPGPLRKLNWPDIAFGLLPPMLAVLAALVIGAVLLALLGANPFEAYAALVGGALGDVSGLTQSMVKATPLLLVGLGIVIAFRASVINIGGEGQIIAGALMATWFSLAFRTWPSWLLITATLIMGFLAGAAWGFIPGVLKARLGVNEILSTVMMNAIALQLMNFLLRGPLMDPNELAKGTFIAQSERLPEAVWLPRLVPQTLLHTGAILAVVLAVLVYIFLWLPRLVPQTLLHTGAILAVALAVLVYIFLWRTTIGYRIRAVGLNPDAARYAGLRVPVYQVLSLTLAGGFAGLAGVVEVIGVHHRLLEGITGGYGFSGIVAALFGNLHPISTIPASFLFGALLVGADKMQRAVQVPSALVGTLLGLVVLFVVGSALWTRRRAARRAAETEEFQSGASLQPGALPAMTNPVEPSHD